MHSITSHCPSKYKLTATCELGWTALCSFPNKDRLRSTHIQTIVMSWLESRKATTNLPILRLQMNEPLQKEKLLFPFDRLAWFPQGPELNSILVQQLTRFLLLWNPPKNDLLFLLKIRVKLTRDFF